MNFIFDNNFLTFGFLKVKQWLECTNWKILILKINSAVEDFFSKSKKQNKKKFQYRAVYYQKTNLLIK